MEYACWGLQGHGNQRALTLLFWPKKCHLAVFHSQHFTILLLLHALNAAVDAEMQTPVQIHVLGVSLGLTKLVLDYKNLQLNLCF